MAMYQSEFTLFMNEWRDKHPEEAKERAKGIALWWDRPQNPTEQKAFDQTKVPQKPYPYQPE